MQGLEKSQLSPLVDLDGLALLFKRYDREVFVYVFTCMLMLLH